MLVRTTIQRSFYQDSVVLMRVAGTIRSRPGVREAAAFMGTPANHELLEQTGLATADTHTAQPNDLILAVKADTEAAAEAALAAAQDLLRERRKAVEQKARLLPRTLDSALRQMPDANVAAISVPGAYARFEAQRALRRGLHVWLFSDNVPVEDEVALKHEAVRRGLLCMGPDCGTAYLNGTGLGFANVVPRGRVGCVAASGTGLQAVVSRLAALGEGVSHGIGVGGRDLTAEVGGAMTFFALNALAQDPATEALVLVSKPGAAEVIPRLEQVLPTLGKPVVVCCQGVIRPGGDSVRWVATLDDAADMVCSAMRGLPWSPRAFRDAGGVRRRLQAIHARTGRQGDSLLGLYTGGTLAHEAELILETLLGPIAFNPRAAGVADGHRIHDLGDDAYTVGRPHPMIDPGTRTEMLQHAGTDPGVGVILVDLVLGKGSHPDPAGPLVGAWREVSRQAAASGRCLVAVASVVGTPGDPQGLPRQVAQLEEAGIVVLPSNAEAARFAALVAKPGLTDQLLEGVR